LILTLPEIEEEVKKMDAESKALKKEIYKLAWFMRGSLSVNEAFTMDIMDREILLEIIQENLETAKETGLPFFRFRDLSRR
jgi:hypothetical protein